MHHEDKAGVVIGLILAVLIVLGMGSYHTEEMAKVSNDRVVKCTEAMAQAIPDPNDTVERVAFLKDCYGN